MSSCIPCRHSKHALLIEACYPVPTEKGPKASELSYLTYYASARPQKLTKVGAYLERKTKHDIAKGRKNNTKTTLAVVNALLSACPRDINLFSKNVIRILDMVLNTRDLELLNEAIRVFATFCKYHDGSLLDVDPEITQQYDDLIKKFTGFANYANASDSAVESRQVDTRMRIIGLSSLAAATSSAAMRATESRAQVDVILPAILSNLIHSEYLGSLMTANGGKKEVTTPQDNVQHDSVPQVAAHAFKKLFASPQALTVRRALVVLFSYLEKVNLWFPSLNAVSLTNMAFDAMQVQFRTMLVADILQRVASTPSNPPSYKHATLVMMTSQILNSDKSLAGLSVLEVLNALVNDLLRSMEGWPFEGKPQNGNLGNGIAVSDEKDHTEQTGNEDVLYQTVHHNLAKSIGGLAFQTYYANQLNDIMAHLIAKLRPGTTLEVVDGLPITNLRIAILKCLKLVINSGKEADEHGGGEVNSEISMDAWTPSLSLLTDNDFGTRMAYADVLATFFTAFPLFKDGDLGSVSPISPVTPAHSDYSSAKSTRNYFTSLHDTTFLRSAQQTMLDYSLLSEARPGDLISLMELMRASAAMFGDVASIRTVPLLFSIQNNIKNNVVTSDSRKRAYESMVVQVFAWIAKQYHITALETYINELRQSKESRREWSPLVNDSGHHNNTLLSLTFDEFEEHFCQAQPSEEAAEASTTTKPSFEPVEIYVDKDHVVKVMTDDGALREQGDSHGLELERKLYSDFESPTSAIHRMDSFRIRSSRSIDDMKPRLVTPMELTLPEETKASTNIPSINVDNLKEALFSQSLNDRSLDRDSDSVNSSPQPSPLQATRETAVSRLRQDSTSASGGRRVTAPIQYHGFQRETAKVKRPTKLKSAFQNARTANLEKQQTSFASDGGEPGSGRKGQGQCHAVRLALARDDVIKDTGEARAYCTQLCTPELDACVKALLQELLRFQRRQMNTNAIKAKARQRLYLGMREVLKHTQRGKIKCVIMARNIERIHEHGVGLDSRSASIIKACHASFTPIVYSMTRHALGEVIRGHRKYAFACVGVANVDGAEQQFKAMLEQREKDEKAWVEQFSLPTFALEAASEAVDRLPQVMYNSRQENPLWLTAYYEHSLPSLIDRCVENGWNINQRDTHFRYTPFLAACASGNTVFADHILRKYSANIDLFDASARHETALHLACAGGHHDILRLLLEAGTRLFSEPILSKWFNATNDTQQTALRVAVQKCHAHCAQMLLQESWVDYRHPTAADANILELAIKSGSTNIVQAVLERDSRRDQDDEEPLWRTTCTENTTMLVLAVQQPSVQLDIVRHLLQASIPSTVLTKTKRRGQAIMTPDPTFVNARDASGRTALWWAAWHGQADIVRLLVVKGEANVSLANDAHQLPRDVVGLGVPTGATVPAESKMEVVEDEDELSEASADEKDRIKETKTERKFGEAKARILKLLDGTTGDH
ncbi:hypothetical protein BZG36_02854 [Bifiguratus adelaidae]|uniref:Ribosomal protein eL8/eL30/eS12/Gadd45 domain-containing protein n=1 Tax=Bifiguratus adelaidae TaxID=1938954 RepID=A0A261Y0H4_9FUNG|nr:hypothetical protein BZG36_02854 [Bifiguratus adelaidae]